jgi:hypothetical protein
MSNPKTIFPQFFNISLAKNGIKKTYEKDASTFTSPPFDFVAACLLFLNRSQVDRAISASHFYITLYDLSNTGNDFSHPSPFFAIGRLQSSHPKALKSLVITLPGLD